MVLDTSLDSGGTSGDYTTTEDEDVQSMTDGVTYPGDGSESEVSVTQDDDDGDGTLNEVQTYGDDVVVTETDTDGSGATTESEARQEETQSSPLDVSPGSSPEETGAVLAVLGIALFGFVLVQGVTHAQ